MAKAVCTKCGKEIGFLEMLGYDHKSGWCKGCITTYQNSMKEWKQYFVKACADGILSPEEWRLLTQLREKWELQEQQLLEYVRADALNLVQRTFTFARSDGYLDEAEEVALHELISQLKLDGAALHIKAEMQHLAKLRDIHQGNIVAVKAKSAVLPADELCYLDVPVTYYKPGKKEATQLPGKLILTHKRLIFAAANGGGEVALKKILNVDTHPGGIFVQLSQAKLNGFYTCTPADIIAETIRTVIRMANRQLVATSKDGRDTRSIPQHIKMEVWQRDQGQCVQCHKTEYLEFDHVIPRSKGGATSVNNLQLLCRKCNLAKSDSL